MGHHPYRATILFFLCTAVYAVPPINQIKQKLLYAEKAEWQLDRSRTSCSLGSEPDDQICSNKTCVEVLVFNSNGKVQRDLTCDLGEHKATTNNAEWHLGIDKESQDNIMFLDNETYVVLFDKDGKLMSLTNVPNQREKAVLRKVYKRN